MKVFWGFLENQGIVDSWIESVNRVSWVSWEGMCSLNLVSGAYCLPFLYDCGCYTCALIDSL